MVVASCFYLVTSLGAALFVAKPSQRFVVSHADLLPSDGNAARILDWSAELVSRKAIGNDAPTSPIRRSQRSPSTGIWAFSAVSQKCHKNRGLVGRWSSKYNWVRRAAEYDAEEDRLWRQSLMPPALAPFHTHLLATVYAGVTSQVPRGSHASYHLQQGEHR